MSLDALTLRSKLREPSANAELLDALLPLLTPAAARRWPDANQDEVALALASGVARGVELWDGHGPAAHVLTYHAMRAVELARVTLAAA